MKPARHDFRFPNALGALPPEVRATVRAARRAVRTAAPEAQEVSYRSGPPASRSAMWKLARYRLADADVVGIGAFAAHATLYFYRGRDLDDGSGLLQGGGKDMRFVRLSSPADASSARLKRLLREAFRLAPLQRARTGREAARATTRGIMKGNAATIDDYLALVTGKRRAALDALRRTIRSIVPDAEECISYGIPAFRVHGRVVGGFAATADGGSYYSFSGRTLDSLAPDLTGYSRTKSALHFGPGRTLPAALVRKLLRARMAESRR
jgi:uncharacterized protein YdhG (YjbR/CyaY superfamily)